MARSLSLAAYLTLRRGQGDGQAEAPPAREELRPALRAGEALVWIHCPDATRLGVVAVIADALEAEGRAARLVVTLDDPASATAPVLSRGRRATLCATPPDYRGPARAFLDALRPDLMVWLQGALRPVLIDEAARREIPRLLVDVSAAGLALDGGEWIPGAVAALTREFDMAFAIDHQVGQRLGRMGLTAAQVQVSGPLEPLPRPPSCNEAERHDLAEAIGPRPIWLAADLPLSELDEVIAAHRQAARAAHRLLLIASPARAQDVEPMRLRLAEAGLTLALRSESEEPEEATEVWLADGPEETGLWFRLAQMTYLGGTLTTGGTRHPFEAAALGAAILHGPATGAWAEPFARLTRAGAARAVRSGANLGHAVEALLAPDRCATMVEAAWEVSTAGAVVANRVAAAMNALLTGRESA